MTNINELKDALKETLEEKGVLNNDKLKASKLHLCMDKGETYSGSFLVTKERMMYKNISFNLTTVQCEHAVQMMASSKKILETLDVLDLSVINLSTYERLLLRQRNITDEAEMLKLLDPIKDSGVLLKNLSTSSQHNSRRLSTQHHINDTIFTNLTVVIMPVLLSAKGESYSKIANRKIYLSACFWSFYGMYKNIVAFVHNEEDFQYIR